MPGVQDRVVAWLVLSIGVGVAVPGLVAGELAGVTPQFPYGPVEAVPLGPIQGGSVGTWLGSDSGSMAVFPDGSTTFWVFGDTFIGPPGAVDRSFPKPKVINSIALGVVRPDPGTGSRRFQPFYYYRGNFTYSGRSITQHPSPFFVDPDAYSDDPNNTPANAPDPRSIFPPNRNVANPTGAITRRPLTDAQVSRFWPGKAFFYQNKLFVFVNRYSYSGLPLGTSLARVNNAVSISGGPTDPRIWRIDYIKLSTINRQDPLYAPNLGAEVVQVDHEDLLIYGVISSQPGGRTFLVKMPLELLTSTPGGAEISAKLRYLSESERWETSSVPGQPIGRGDKLFDPKIPGGGGFTVRQVAGTKLWRNVFIDFANDPQHVSVQYAATPLGPFKDRQHVFRLPELDKTNTPLDINKLVNGFNVGIYNPWLDRSSIVKCYMAYETPAFATDPDGKIAFTYSVDDAGDHPPFPEGCHCAPGEPAHWVWDNNFYRVKGVPEQTPYPVNVP